MSIVPATPEEWLSGIEFWLPCGQFLIPIERLPRGTYVAPTVWLPISEPEPPSGGWMRKVCEQAQNAPRNNAYVPGVRL